MNAQARDQLSRKDKHHRIFFRILHSFEEDKDDNDEQRKEHFFREEILFESIRSLEI
jgi:gluconate kinase